MPRCSGATASRENTLYVINLLALNNICIIIYA